MRDGQQARAENRSVRQALAAKVSRHGIKSKGHIPMKLNMTLHEAAWHSALELTAL